MRGVEEYKKLARDWVSMKPMKISYMKAGEAVKSAFEAEYSTKPA